MRPLAARFAKTAVIAGLLASVTTSAHAATARFGGPFTDNYKAGYNAAPASREMRTWFASKSLSVGAVTFRPAALPATGQAYTAAGDGLKLRGSDGSAAVLTASTVSANVTSQGFFRVDANGDFGLLARERSLAALKTAPIHETFALRRAGVAIATAAADYVYDPRVADAPATSREFNGPGGRWYVGGVATRLDWEPAAPARDVTPPALTAVSIPATTASRRISIAITATDDIGVAHVRFANEDGTWTPWQPYGPALAWTLSAGPGFKGVFTQVRDAAGNTSAVVFRRVTCASPCA